MLQVVKAPDPGSDKASRVVVPSVRCRMDGIPRRLVGRPCRWPRLGLPYHPREGGRRVQPWGYHAGGQRISGRGG